MRSSGILMHITSLPSPGGIGTLGQEAYEFADFLQAVIMPDIRNRLSATETMRADFLISVPSNVVIFAHFLTIY